MQQLERLMRYPMVARRVEAGQLFLHGWCYVIEDGQVLVLDAETGQFELLSRETTAPGTAIEVDAMHWARLDRAP